MARIIHIVTKVFEGIFVPYSGLSSSMFARLTTFIVNQPYLILGVAFLIIGFSIGLIKRIIKS